MKSPYILHKAIAIPVDTSNSKPVFLTVLDKRHHEWVFVTGGCRKTEVSNPLMCALRELHEETRGVVQMKMGRYMSFQFEVDTWCNKLGSISNIYHVYILEYSQSLEKQRELIDAFENMKNHMNERKQANLPVKRTWDENDSMEFETLDKMIQKKVWSIIMNNVIKNPKFTAALDTQKWKTFNISNNINDAKQSI